MTTRDVEGDVDGMGIHLGIAVASWNRSITDRLLDGALRRCAELGVAATTVARVAGALELPVTALALARSGCNAIVAIGTVIRGDTDHYEVVVRESASGLSRVALDTGVPVANAVLAVNSAAQAVERAGLGTDNKGGEAVDAAVTAANTLREIRR